MYLQVDPIFLTTFFVLLNWWTFNWTIAAINAAVALHWFQKGLAIFTFVKILASVCRHFFFFFVSAVWTGYYWFCYDFHIANFLKYFPFLSPDYEVYSKKRIALEIGFCAKYPNFVPANSYTRCWRFVLLRQQFGFRHKFIVYYNLVFRAVVFKLNFPVRIQPIYPQSVKSSILIQSIDILL